MAAGQQGAGPGRKLMIHDGDGRDHDIEFEDIFPEASATLASPPTTGGKIQVLPAQASNGNGFAPDPADTDAMLDAAHDEYARQVLTEPADVDAALDASVSNNHHPSQTVEGGEAREEISAGQATPLPYSERPISLYESPVRSGRHLNRRHTTMAELHAMVVEGAWNDDVEQLREIVAHKGERDENGHFTAAAREYDGRKAALIPYFTAGGVFQAGKRTKSALIATSGIRMMDIDSLAADEAVALREKAKKLPYCVAAWVSSSGLGVHLYLAQEPRADATNDWASWEALAAALELHLGVRTEAQDASVKDISRACFGSYDPDAYLNPQAGPLAWTPPALGEEEKVTEEGESASATQHQPASGSQAKGQKQDKSKKSRKKSKGRIQDAATAERERMDLETALEFLAQEKVGEDDNRLLAVGKNLKAMGHQFLEFDAWAAGAGCTCTDRPNRWKSFHARDRDYSTIIGMAVNMGCKLGLQTWQQYGRWLGRRYALEYRYDSKREEWWRWRDNQWINAKGALPAGLAKRLGDEIGTLDRELAALSGTFLDKDSNEVRLLRLTEKTLDKVRPQGITRGLQLALDRPFPDYAKDDTAREMRSRLLATATGVVDLVTGTIEAHNPLNHDTRAVAAGGYHPDDIEDANALLWDRLKLVLAETQFGVFLSYLGMSVSGQGQSFRSVILCQGKEGSGKGGVNFLLKSAWSGRARTLPMSLLERSTKEIDVTRYTLMRDQPLFLLLDENGEINTSTLTSITGNTPLPAARLPYMDNGYEDTIPGTIWWATVETPALTRKTGIDRRLGYLAFKRQIADEDKDARQWHSQDLKDAMVTAGVHQAIRWLRREVKDPKALIPGEVLADMDPLQHFISTLDPEVYEGALVSKAHEDVNKLLGRPVTSTRFGTAVSKNDTWRKEQAPSGEHAGRMIMRIRKADSWG